MNKYNAVILAAGRGSRMGDSTKKSHKCLTILMGKTLLDWQLKALEGSGIKNITVVGGYRSKMLNGKFNKLENSRWSETNMVSSFFCYPKIKTETIVSYSDIVYSESHVSSLMKVDGDIVILADQAWLKLWSIRFNNPLSDAESFKTEGNVLKEIGKSENKIENIQAQYMGLLKFSPKGWVIANEAFNLLKKKDQDQIDMTSFLSILIKKTQIKVAFISGGWCEVDSNSDVKAYEICLENNANWTHDWRN